jgi:hypothetical protein
MSDAARTEHATRNAEEAAAIIRRAPANSSFFLHVRMDAPLADGAHYIPGGFSAPVEVSRGVAERFVTDAFRASLTDKGCVLRIVEHVGARRTRWKADTMEREEYGNPRRHYWIG